MTRRGDGGSVAAGRAATPSLARRMACFVYEATLLFGLALIPGALGAFFLAQTGQRHPLQSDTALRVYALVLYGVYFVWLLVAARPDAGDADLAHPPRHAAGARRLAGARPGALCRLLLRLVRAGDRDRRRRCTGRRRAASAPSPPESPARRCSRCSSRSASSGTTGLCGTRLVEAGARAAVPR